MTTLLLNINQDLAYAAQRAAVERIDQQFSRLVGIVAEEFSTQPRRILSRSRIFHTAEARQVVMHLARTLIRLKYQEIGDRLSRDHSTIITGEQAITRRARVDADLATRIDICRRRFADGAASPATITPAAEAA